MNVLGDRNAIMVFYRRCGMCGISFRKWSKGSFRLGVVFLDKTPFNDSGVCFSWFPFVYTTENGSMSRAHPLLSAGQK